MKATIEEKLQQLNPISLLVIDNSSHHAGHSGNNGGGHFRIEIVSEIFENLNPVQRHQKIYSLFQEELSTNQIHALSIDAKSGSEEDN